MHRLRRLAAVLAVVVMSTAAGAQPASAAPGVVVTAVTGAGTISPGLVVQPFPQTFTFNGTVTGLFTAGTQTVNGSVSCSFVGTDNVGSTALGQGTATGACNGSGVTVNGTVVFARVAVIIEAVFMGTVCVNGTCMNAIVFVTLAFIPSNVNPTTAYSVTGEASGFGV